MRIAIVQSSYVPWRGFFDILRRCDEYVIFDQVQYVKRHWHNRNRIKTPNGVEWLTIPVVTKGRYDQPIDQVEIENPDGTKSWADKHWRAIELAYGRAPHFDCFAPAIRDLYKRAGERRLLTQVNALFLTEIAALLGLTTRIVRDTAYPAEGVKTARLLAIAKQAGASVYLSGPSAKAYLDVGLFEAAGIAVEWMDYDSYPDYPQPHGGFEPFVSVLDLMFNTGADAASYIKPSAAGRVQGAVD